MHPMHINHINIVGIIENTMNWINPLLANHGAQTGYLVYRSLKPLGYTDTQLRDAVLTAILHDIGAYDAQDVKSFFRAESVGAWSHAIYGYLFMKYFSPLQDNAPALLYHHADVEQSRFLPESQRILANMIHLCDRAELFYRMGQSREGFLIHAKSQSGKNYCPMTVDLYVNANIQWDEVAHRQDDDGYRQLLTQTHFSDDDMMWLLQMLVFSIDFRSSQTMLHTFDLMQAAQELAALSGLDSNARHHIKIASLLHDIGKVATPLHILESDSKLTDEEMAVMRDHIVMTDQIIRNHVPDEIANMAINHHEKLDGSGYPKQLRAEQLPKADRIIAIADILSALWGRRSYKPAFPKERIVGILQHMRDHGQLDASLIDLSILHYDHIADAIVQSTHPIKDTYEAMTRERTAMTDAIARGEYQLL